MFGKTKQPKADPEVKTYAFGIDFFGTVIPLEHGQSIIWSKRAGSSTFFIGLARMKRTRILVQTVETCMK